MAFTLLKRVVCIAKMRSGRCCFSVSQTRLLRLVLLLLLVSVVLAALLPPADDQRGAGILGVLRREKEDPVGEDQEAGGGPADEQFTIVIQSYNRTDLLLRLLNHYQAMPRLRSVVVVWNNVGEKTPERLWNSLGPHPVQVVFKEQTSNLMRNRLQPFDEIKTDAVLMLDDDTLISLPDISFAFSVWKQLPEQIVGYVPRKHVPGPRGVLSYGSFELQDPEAGGGDRYSMVLIGAAFFHRRYLQLFQDQPRAVHALVDDTQNCDDIAMNFAVALDLRTKHQAAGGVCRPSGVFVKPVDLRNLEKDASSGYQGMWHRPEHLLQRSYCLNRLTAIHGLMPLCFSNLMVSQFGFPSYANHKNRG